jgi:hypothetical protein
MQKQARCKARAIHAKPKEPLAEGIMKNRPYGFFTKMSDKELVVFAKKVVEEKGIRSRYGLVKEDRGLYQALWKRKLLDKIELEDKRRKVRNWNSLSDDELVVFAKKIVEEKEIKSRSELKARDNWPYLALLKRKLLDRIEFEEGNRDWELLSDKELVIYAKKFVEERGIRNRRGLQKEDSGLYCVLLKRKLLDRIRFEYKRRKVRNWNSLSDDELVVFAKKIVDEKEIRNRRGLQKEDSGLNQVLRKRKLLDKIEFEESNRDWRSKCDEELVVFAKEFVARRGIRNRYGLEKEDRRLYQTLLKRKLLDAVFSEIEKFKEIEAVREVVEALREFP